MNVLIDSDVLIDYLTGREPFTVAAKKLMKKVHEKIINAYLAPHSITNIFYILRKHSSVDDRRVRLIDLCQSIPVAEVKTSTVLNALANTNIDDVEDCLQTECAKVVNADYIVTRNIKDYAKSEIPAILPEDLLKMI